MRASRTWKRVVAGALAADTEAMDDDESDGTDESAEDSGEELALECELEVAAGTTLNLDECPDDWDPLVGVDGDEIRVGAAARPRGG